MTWLDNLLPENKVKYEFQPESDAIAEFWNGRLLKLKYNSSDDDGKRAQYTDALLEAAKEDGAYAPLESAPKNQKHIVYWFSKKKEQGEGD